MRKVTILAIAALGLSSCTGAHIKKPAVCDGKHRRPANLYGSVLPTLPVPLPPSQSGGQLQAAPGRGPGPGALPAPPSAPPTVPPDQSGSSDAPDVSGAARPVDATGSPTRMSQRDLAPTYPSC